MFSPDEAHIISSLGQIKKVFGVTGLKILGRVGTHIFFWKKYYLMHFERRNMHKNIYFFTENLKEIQGFTCKLR